MSTDQHTTAVTLAALLASVDTLYTATDFTCDKVASPALTTAYLAIGGLAHDNGIHWDAVRGMADKMAQGEAQDASDAASAAVRGCPFGGVL